LIPDVFWEVLVAFKKPELSALYGSLNPIRGAHPICLRDKVTNRRLFPFVPHRFSISAVPHAW